MPSPFFWFSLKYQIDVGMYIFTHDSWKYTNRSHPPLQTYLFLSFVNHICLESTNLYQVTNAREKFTDQRMWQGNWSKNGTRQVINICDKTICNVFLHQLIHTLEWKPLSARFIGICTEVTVPYFPITPSSNHFALMQCTGVILKDHLLFIVTKKDVFACLYFGNRFC